MAVGDHLVVQFGWYQHHGIDVGDGQVVHFGRGLHDLENAEIEVVERDVFCGGREVKTIESDAKFSPSAIKERALSRVGERGYNLETNNCEHFANWCRRGVMSSRQSEMGETLVRQSFSAMAKPVVSRGVGNLAARLLSNRAGGAVLLKSIGKTTPVLLLADAAQTVAELAATACGKTKEDSRKMGIRSGASVSAMVGFAAAGGVGTVTGLATWLISQKIGETLVRSLNHASHPSEAGENSENV